MNITTKAACFIETTTWSITVHTSLHGMAESLREAHITLVAKPELMDSKLQTYITIQAYDRHHFTHRILRGY